MFVVHRIYSDENGDSHFDELEIPLHPQGMAGQLSDPIDVKSVIFREVDPDYDWDFHPAPARQYIVLLDGEIEIETSLHKVKRFRQGDILLVEDTTGKGHKTKNIKPIKRKSLFITLG